MAFHTIEICAGVGMLGEGLRAGFAHMGIPLRTVAYLERETYPAACLAARIEEGSLDPAPVWSDLLTFNAGAWRCAVDGIVAGFPCQDLSLAGRRAGLDGKRSGLFFNILDIADACGAWFLFLENVAGIASATASVVDEAEGELEERAAARVVGELAERGWHAEWLTLSASEVGASHGRERWFCFAWRVADTTGSDTDTQHATDVQRRRSGQAQQTWLGSGAVGNTTGTGQQEPGRRRKRELPAQAEAGLHDRSEQPKFQLAPASATVECELCGHHFPEHLGRYGCPNCEGTGIEPMADPQRIGGKRRGKPSDLACTGSEAEGEARERQRGGPAADSGCDPMANACCQRLAQRTGGGDRL